MTTHGQYKTGTYHSWQAMKRRCTVEKDAKYHLYGGRGITVCERWLNSFENFWEDMGNRPVGTTIDRIDNDGNYEPSNCKWATPKEQNSHLRQRSIPSHCPNGHEIQGILPVRRGSQRCGICRKASALDYYYRTRTAKNPRKRVIA